MEFKGLLFGGIAIVIAIIFCIIGWYTVQNTDDRIATYQKEVDSYEDPDGANHMWIEVDKNFANYTKAKDNLQDAKDSKSTSYIWFTIGGICLLIGIVMIIVHLVLERSADKKMADSFFVDSRQPRDRR
jgi:hypothetical protein